MAKNKDGQIALAEWPRDQLAEFNKLDKNMNGFLTLQEWLAGLAKANQDEASKRAADANATFPCKAICRKQFTT